MFRSEFLLQTQEICQKGRKKAIMIHFKIEGLFLMNVLGFVFFFDCGALVTGNQLTVVPVPRVPAGGARQ